MKKVQQYKGFVIAKDEENRFQIFKKDEWILGKGYRYPEHDSCTIEEAREFIDSY